jgi:hypothetical protein
MLRLHSIGKFAMPLPGGRDLSGSIQMKEKNNEQKIQGQRRKRRIGKA